jgi:hypothetical protein
MAFIGKPVNTPADANARVAATQPSATQPSATQPTATQPAAPEPAVATTPPADNPLRPPFQSGQASVETGETPATNK